MIINTFFTIIKKTKKRRDVRQVYGFSQANGTPGGLPAESFPSLKAGDGSLDVLDPTLSLLHM